MTGRGAGFCNGLDAPESVRPGRGMGRGACGGGRGHRWRNQFRATGQGRWAGPANQIAASPTGQEQQINSLNEQVSSLRSMLDQVKEKIEKLGIKSEQK
ncbi:MAG: hypothetical protein CXZ00_08950 [Acidobacteria bacterium]|nr:MAG: hypothetical protein CXZ00_08950 [Acidobacteriota bacterium]